MGQEREESPNWRNANPEIKEDGELPNLAEVKRKDEPSGQIYIVAVHGFKGSEVERLYSHHHSSFSKRFIWENRPLPHPHRSGTSYLAIMWQNQHFWEDFGSSVLSLSLTLNL